MFKIAGGFFRELDVSPRAWRLFGVARDGFLDKIIVQKLDYFQLQLVHFLAVKILGLNPVCNLDSAKILDLSPNL